jgi:predicted amidophosphoribosyltransferase
MECPHCGYLLAFSACSECGGEIPAKSRYCCWCGNPITVEAGETDLSERKLCSDGSCVGTINEEGICSVCSKPYSGEPA